mmetsp:Transcript_3330/g.8038  ORF Transcript_3330/g.8038 Transcript_3330/m.8038 type:complete len:230 (+) Transcript_3330:1664-2353(+)
MQRRYAGEHEGTIGDDVDDEGDGLKDLLARPRADLHGKPLQRVVGSLDDRQLRLRDGKGGWLVDDEEVESDHAWLTHIPASSRRSAIVDEHEADVTSPLPEPLPLEVEVARQVEMRGAEEQGGVTVVGERSDESLPLAPLVQWLLGYEHDLLAVDSTVKAGDDDVGEESPERGRCVDRLDFEREGGLRMVRSVSGGSPVILQHDGHKKVSVDIRVERQAQGPIGRHMKR